MQGDRRDYNELIAQFQNAAPIRTSEQSQQPSSSSSHSASPQQLKSWLEALIHAVSQLDDRHRPLVDAIASLPWTTYEDSVRRSFIRFHCVLVAARPEHLKPILEKVVYSLRWGPSYSTPATPTSSLTLNLFFRHSADSCPKSDHTGLSCFSNQPQTSLR